MSMDQGIFLFAMMQKCDTTVRWVQRVDKSLVFYEGELSPIKEWVRKEENYDIDTYAV